jgi:glyoxylase-like metal-dependent hydrolase (beta-lactamase superfamily II)
MAVHVPYVRDIKFEYGRLEPVSPLIRRVVANNPGPFTYTGTGTYVVGRGKVAVIDPGPDLGAHVDAILDGLGDETVSHIVVTHCHLDHSPAARALKERTGAPTYAFGPHGSGPASPARAVVNRVEEGADHDFDPDVRLADGEIVAGEGWTLEAVHTPGHTSNHLCFALREENAFFSGDHVMGWSTSIVAPPDGDMSAYMASLRKLLGRREGIYWPTHGPAITAPRPHVEAFIAHREDRERQVLARIAAGDDTIGKMVPVMYAEVDKRLHPAAAFSVLSHLIQMVEEGRVVADGPAGLEARYAIP